MNQTFAHTHTHACRGKTIEKEPPPKSKIPLFVYVLRSFSSFQFSFFFSFPFLILLCVCLFFLSCVHASSVLLLWYNLSLTLFRLYIHTYWLLNSVGMAYSVAISHWPTPFSKALNAHVNT